MVRMKVARSGLMFSTPTLAKIAVSAAKQADSSAQVCQAEKRAGFMRMADAVYRGSEWDEHDQANRCRPGQAKRRSSTHTVESILRYTRRRSSPNTIPCLW